MTNRSAFPASLRLRQWKCSILALAFTSVASGTAQAAVTQCVGTTSAALCPPNVTTCTVSSSVEIAKDAVLDCTNIHLSLTTISADLWVDHGAFSLSAKSLSVASGGRIRALADSANVVGFAITVEQTMNVSGKLEAPNAGRGSFIYLEAGGNVTMGVNTPAVNLAGSTTSCDGGELYISSGGTVTINKRIDAHGKDGGDENNINAGGIVTIQALNDILIKDEIRAFGRFFDGGIVELYAGRSVAVDWQSGTNLPKGEIVIEGRNDDGYGGILDIVAANAITISGKISAASGVAVSGGYGQGGDVGLVAGCGGVSISGNIDIWGGGDGGGSLVVDSDGPINLSSTIDARGRKYGGWGGDVALASGKTVTLTKTAFIQADGHNPSTQIDNGRGGIVLVQGCQVDVQDDASTGAKITTLGYIGGQIAIQGAKSGLGGTGYSVRVGDKSLVSGSGESQSVAPRLQVTERRFGICSNSSNTCQTNSNCAGGTCVSPNPDTQGTVAQFVPTPTISQASTIPACTTVCP